MTGTRTFRLLSTALLLIGPSQVQAERFNAKPFSSSCASSQVQQRIHHVRSVMGRSLPERGESKAALPAHLASKLANQKQQLRSLSHQLNALETQQQKVLQEARKAHQAELEAVPGYHAYQVLQTQPAKLADQKQRLSLAHSRQAQENASFSEKSRPTLWSKIMLEPTPTMYDTVQHERAQSQEGRHIGSLTGEIAQTSAELAVARNALPGKALDSKKAQIARIQAKHKAEIQAIHEQYQPQIATLEKDRQRALEQVAGSLSSLFKEYPGAPRRLFQDFYMAGFPKPAQLSSAKALATRIESLSTQAQKKVPLHRFKERGQRQQARAELVQALDQFETLAPISPWSPAGSSKISHSKISSG